MIQIAPQMRTLVAVDSVDFRRGIDGHAALCTQAFKADPLSGTVFVFRSRSGKALRCLTYDGQGYWLAQVVRAEPGNDGADNAAPVYVPFHSGPKPLKSGDAQ